MKTRSRSRTALVALTLAATPVVLTGCSTAGEGAVSGAGVGALTGLVLGSLTGGAGQGALIGTAAGAVIGGVVGDQNERNANYSRQQAEAYRSAPRYEPAPRHDDGWGRRYDDRGTTYHEERYIEYRSEPRVIVRYESSPRYTTRYSYTTRYGKSSRWDRRGWNYRDPYCR